MLANLCKIACQPIAIIWKKLGFGVEEGEGSSSSMSRKMLLSEPGATLVVEVLGRGLSWGGADGGAGVA